MAKGARESTWDGVLLGETYQYLLLYPLPPKYNPYSDTSFSLLLGKTTIRTLATSRKLIWEEVQYLGKKQMPLLDNGKKKKNKWIETGCGHLPATERLASGL